MGLFDAVSNGVEGILNQSSPTQLFDSAGNIATTGLATNLLSGAASGAMRGILGMDTSPCPPTSGDSAGSGAGTNSDPCGRNDDPLKSALLGLGMTLAGPSIEAAGASIGAGLDAGLGAVANGIGSAFSSATSAISGATGIDSSIVSSALGASAAATATGGSGLVGAVQGITAGVSAKQSTSSFSATSALSQAKSAIGI